MSIARVNQDYRASTPGQMSDRARSEELRILAALPGTDEEILLRVNSPVRRGMAPLITQPGLAAHLSMMPVERGADGVVRAKGR